MTGKKVYVTTDYHEKQLQRALLQFSRPENANLVREALKVAGREDLIGNSPDCLVRHAFGQGKSAELKVDRKSGKLVKHGSKPAASRGSSQKSTARSAAGKSTAAKRSEKPARRSDNAQNNRKKNASSPRKSSVKSRGR